MGNKDAVATVTGSNLLMNLFSCKLHAQECKYHSERDQYFQLLQYSVKNKVTKKKDTSLKFFYTC